MDDRNLPPAAPIRSHRRTTAASDKDHELRGSSPGPPSSPREPHPRENRDDDTTLYSATSSSCDLSKVEENHKRQNSEDREDQASKQSVSHATSKFLGTLARCTARLLCYPPRPSGSESADATSDQRDSDPGVEVKDDNDDDDDDASSVASVTSAALRGKIENGRLYAGFGSQEYGMPMDTAEKEKLSLCHTKYFALLDQQRFLAPVGNHPQKILDLGCGTGEWVIDVADMFPTAEVLGVDIAPAQRDWVPPNCQFELDDIEQPWTRKEDSFDFIFARDLLLSVRDWPRLIDQIYRHLKPGGWVELQCISGPIACDDGSLPKDSSLNEFSAMLSSSTKQFGTPIDDPARYADWLRDRGFQHVSKVVHKIPCNPWPRSEKHKLVGAFERGNLATGLEGMVIRLFSRTMGWSPEEVNAFLVDVRTDLKNENYHCYWPYTVVYAQKPGCKPVPSG
ncbi:hypothetical protein VTJ49DRAFT_2921 [Mycothermus thermophilus]|uniref:Methyltransferase n=1 Tax=Humicola insolens TaxID=85995 RepID=A0ABR3V8R0_HUMIN